MLYFAADNEFIQWIKGNNIHVKSSLNKRMRCMQNEKLWGFFVFLILFCVCKPLPPTPTPLPLLGTARWQSSSSAVLFTHSSCLMGVLLPSLREAVCLQNHTRDKRKLLFSQHSRGWGARGAAARLCAGRCMFQLQCSGKAVCVCVFSYQWHPCFHCCRAGGLLSFNLPLWAFSWLGYINIRHFYSNFYTNTLIFFFLHMNKYHTLWGLLPLMDSNFQDKKKSFFFCLN